jgi:hypothetical protein
MAQHTSSSRLMSAVTFLATVSTLFVAQARAGVAIDTFGAGDTYAGGTDMFGFNGFAFRFVATSTTTIDRVTAAMRHIGPGSAPVAISITYDSGNSPAATSLWTSTEIEVGPAGIYEFHGILFALGPGVYWVIAFAEAGIGSFYWNDNTANTSGLVAQGSPWVVTSHVLPAVRVDSTPTTGACCSLVSGACTPLSAASCALLGLRYDGDNSMCGTVPCHACPADFNHSGGLSTQDIFDFLNAWFAGCP